MFKSYLYFVFDVISISYSCMLRLRGSRRVAIWLVALRAISRPPDHSAAVDQQQTNSQQKVSRGQMSVAAGCADAHVVRVVAGRQARGSAELASHRVALRTPPQPPLPLPLRRRPFV